MNQVVVKLQSLEQNLAAEKGPFRLFGLLLREEAPDKWDLVVSAHWLDENHREGLRLLSRRMLETLTSEELLRISRIVIIEPDNPGLKAIQRSVAVEHGDVEMQHCTLFGMPIKYAHIITSQRPGARHAQQPA